MFEKEDISEFKLLNATLFVAKLAIITIASTIRIALIEYDVYSSILLYFACLIILPKSVER
jgi:hypothetical protein